MSDVREQITALILDALERGALSPAELTARQIGAFLGRTTGHVYHHFGSLEELLFALSQAGFRALTAHLASCAGAGGTLADVAAEFVAYGLDHAPLYSLMFERRYDWALLRGRGLLGPQQQDVELWHALIAELSARGANNPHEDARLVLAALHGLVSMSLSGRANVGALEHSDREVAIASARRLIALVVPSEPDAPARTRRAGDRKLPRRRPGRATRR